MEDIFFYLGYFAVLFQLASVSCSFLESLRQLMDQYFSTAVRAFLRFSCSCLPLRVCVVLPRSPFCSFRFCKQTEWRAVITNPFALSAVRVTHFLGTSPRERCGRILRTVGCPQSCRGTVHVLKRVGLCIFFLRRSSVLSLGDGRRWSQSDRSNLRKQIQELYLVYNFKMTSISFESVTFCWRILELDSPFLHTVKHHC